MVISKLILNSKFSDWISEVWNVVLILLIYNFVVID